MKSDDAYLNGPRPLLLDGAELRPEGAALEVLLANQGQCHALYGLAPVPPHLGYDRPLVMLRALAAKGCKVTVLLADANVIRRSGQDTASGLCTLWEQHITMCCGPQVAVIKESDLAANRPDYAARLLALPDDLRLSDVRDVLPRQLKQTNVGPSVNDLLAPLKQCLDALHFQPDIIIADASNAKIYRLLPRLVGGHYQPKFVFLPTAHDIRGEHIIESSAANRITLVESPDSLADKVKRMFAPPAKAELEHRANALLETVIWSVMPLTDQALTVQTSSGVAEFTDVRVFLDNWDQGVLHPADVKNAVVAALQERLKKFKAVLPASVLSHLDLDRARGVVSTKTEPQHWAA